MLRKSLLGLVCSCLLLLSACAWRAGSETPGAALPAAPGETPAAEEAVPEEDGTAALRLGEENARAYFQQLGYEMLHYQEGDGLALAVYQKPGPDWLSVEFIDEAGRRTPVTNSWYRLPDTYDFTDINRLEVIGDIGRAEWRNDDFPERITYLRLADGSYYEDRDTYYAPLEEAYEVGPRSGETACLLTDIFFTASGVELAYEAQPGHEGNFYAAYSKIPRHSFYYDSDNHQLFITVANTRYAGEVKALTNNVLAAATGLTMTDSSGDDLYICLLLNRNVASYHVDWRHMNFAPPANTHHDKPYLTVDFAIDPWQ